MKSLPAGNKKFLLLDSKTVELNSTRGNPGAPVAVVIEAIEHEPGVVTYVRHVGYQVLTLGTVSIDYSQRGSVVENYFPGSYPRERLVRAAYMTTGEVLIAEDRDEVLAAPEPAPPAKPSKSTKGN